MSGRGMTIAEKIMAAHSGRDRVGAGETVRLDVDLTLAGDDCAAAAESGAARPGMTVLCADPSAAGLGALGCLAAAASREALREARLSGQATLRVPATVKCLLLGDLHAGLHGIDVALALLSRLGAAAAGRLLEFGGDVLRWTPMDSRFGLCATAAAGGALGGVVPADAVTFRYVCARAMGSFVSYDSDPDAAFDSVVEIDASAIEPMAAFGSARTGRAVSDLKPTRIDRAVLGPRTGARFEDLRVAAGILKGRRIAGRVTAIVVPATREVMARAAAAGLLDIFTAAGWRVGDPDGWRADGGGPAAQPAGVCITSGGAAAGMPEGPGDDRTCVASPLTVTASSIAGCITDPRPFLPPAGEINAGASRDDRRRQERPRERSSVIASFPAAAPRKETGRSART